jgi:hypothetical protein
MAKFEQRARRANAGPGDRDLATPAAVRHNELSTTSAHPLDSREALEEHRRLLRWYWWERDKQAENRLQMAIDHDFYDSIQWDDDDKAIVEARGQMALVFNEVGPLVDWLIGTERRNRVDWTVLPRTEDDVQAADVKTKVLKYVSDVNRVPFARSRAFADAVKGGLGWIDDGVRDDPTQDVLYSRYEDWRNVLHDSAAQEYDLSDGRYLFRWRWVDEDVACLMFPDRKDRIATAVESHAYHWDPTAEEDDWLASSDPTGRMPRSGAIYPMSSAYAENAQRRRVKLIEAQYRKPEKVKIVGSGPLRGAFFDQRDSGLVNALNRHGGTIIDKVMMRVHGAVFTESDMLAMGPSIFRHNRFSLTPVWCYRRSRDRAPYGVIRRVRDIQLDLNKRASKAQWLMNSNQVIMDEGAVDDPEEAFDEAQRPDSRIVKRPGKEFRIERANDAAQGQLQLMQANSQLIQRLAGVADENLGRQTNAVSGEAIRARQLQGSVVATEPFDNLRLAVQVQGEKQLSLVEQWYTEEKVIRLTGAKGRIEWVRVNVPEPQPDGSVRYLNDITASMADFVVAEQDYAGTLRQVMFDSLSQLSQRLPPEVALRLLTMAFEFSDLPNKDEIADEIRRLTGDRDPNKQMTPEEQQAAQQQAQQQAESMELQRQSAITALQEQQAKVREINARAAELEANAAAVAMGGGGDGGQGALEVERALNSIREQAADEIDKLSRELAQARMQATEKLTGIRKEADTKAEIARIEAASRERVAEIQAASDEKLDALNRRIEDLVGRLQEVDRKAQESAKKAAEEAKAIAQAAPAPEPAPAAAPAAATAPAPTPVNVVVQPAAPIAEVTLGDGVATVKREDGTVSTVRVKRQAKQEGTAE